MKKALLTTSMYLLCAGAILAQQVVFSVMISKGENLLGDPGNLKPLLIGSGIQQEQLLHVADDGYVSLVHENTGASIELTTPGEYSTGQIERLISRQSTSLLAKYARFLANMMGSGKSANQQSRIGAEPPDNPTSLHAPL